MAEMAQGRQATCVARRNAHGAWQALVVAEGGLVALAVALAALVKANPGPLPGDVGVALAVQHTILPHHWLTQAIEIASTINWPTPAGATVAAVTIGLLLLRRFLNALITFAVSALADVQSYLTNEIVQRPRPSGHGLDILQNITSYFSFPSGHVIHVVAFFGFLLFLTFQTTHRQAWWLWLMRTVLAALIVIIGVSRVVEGEHWPTDVLEGIICGSFWLILGIATYRWARQRFPRLVSREEKAAQTA